MVFITRFLIGALTFFIFRKTYFKLMNYINSIALTIVYLVLGLFLMLLTYVAFFHFLGVFYMIDTAITRKIVEVFF